MDTPKDSPNTDGTCKYHTVENDATGLTPFLMCYTELLLSQKED